MTASTDTCFFLARKIAFLAALMRAKFFYPHPLNFEFGLNIFSKKESK